MTRRLRVRCASDDGDRREEDTARAQALPAAVTIGGEAAQRADFLEAADGNFPLMVALISILTFILLARAFRSLILPLKTVRRPLHPRCTGALPGAAEKAEERMFGTRRERNG